MATEAPSATEAATAKVMSRGRAKKGMRRPGVAWARPSAEAHTRFTKASRSAGPSAVSDASPASSAAHMATSRLTGMLPSSQACWSRRLLACSVWSSLWVSAIVQVFQWPANAECAVCAAIKAADGAAR